MLEVEGVTVAFGDFVVLDDYSLSVEEGEIVALLGSSGCGKTTLLRFIAGLQEGVAGSVSIGGRDVSNIAAERRGVGMVFQNLALFPHLNVEKNLAFGMSNPNSEILLEMLTTVGLTGFEKREIDSLSGGEAQRVALARALLAEPLILLLDEPLASLDEELKLTLARDVRNILKGRNTTAIHVTHDRRIAEEIADRIVLLQ